MLASLSLYALFLFPLVHDVYVDGKNDTIMVSGVYQSANGVRNHTEFFTGLTIGDAIVGLIPLILIFLFRNRKQQIGLGYLTMLIVIAFSFWMAQVVKGVMGGIQIDTHSMGIGLFLSTLSLVFIMLAIKAVQRDEKLIKSADRLR